jgi:hypothetical protein
MSKNKIAQKSIWQLEQESESAVIGSEFARVIASLANGNYSTLAPLKKKIPPFKKLFWDEEKYNPPLANTHITYEYDAHIKPTDRYWLRTGNKFSRDRRIARRIDDAALKGPIKPIEFPQCMELSSKVYERKRLIRPFLKAHVYNKPIERYVPPKKVAYIFSILFY